jgi:hypothetical protein
VLYGSKVDIVFKASRLLYAHDIERKTIPQHYRVLWTMHAHHIMINYRIDKQPYSETIALKLVAV